jgi:hypothetical protein
MYLVNDSTTIPEEMQRLADTFNKRALHAVAGGKSLFKTKLHAKERAHFYDKAAERVQSWIPYSVSTHPQYRATTALRLHTLGKLFIVEAEDARKSWLPKEKRAAHDMQIDADKLQSIAFRIKLTL